MKSKGLLDKQAVSRAFSNAASSYDSIANIQHTTGDLLLTLLDGSGALDRSGLRCLDLGAGTGRETLRLAERAQPSTLLALDIAPGMCTTITSRMPCQAIQADFDSLPVAAGSIDLIFANLALQWSDDLSALLSALHDTLDAGGVIGFNTLLAGSMQEIDAAWATLDDSEHTLEFEQAATLENRLRQFFRIEKLSVDQFTDCHETIEETLQSLRGIGASNHLSNRPKRTMTKSRYRHFLSALEQQALINDVRHERAGEYGLTYVIFSAVCRKI